MKHNQLQKYDYTLDCSPHRVRVQTSDTQFNFSSEFINKALYYRVNVIVNISSIAVTINLLRVLNGSQADFI